MYAKYILGKISACSVPSQPINNQANHSQQSTCRLRYANFNQREKMSLSIRLSESLFRRLLWLVACLFAFFLIGLGKLLLNQLPGVDVLTRDSFIDQTTYIATQKAVAEAENQVKADTTLLESAQLQLDTRRAAYNNEHEAFKNWISTRRATMQSSQDDEVIKRTRTLDQLKMQERKAEEKVETIQTSVLNAQHNLEKVQTALATLLKRADTQLALSQQTQELKVFLIRLAMTLPLLLIAGWLFIKKRKNQYWPFVWGFIFVALFTFFVELVPYLPDYGGYVRYLVGIILIALTGHYVIKAFQRYRENQSDIAQPSETKRHNENLNYKVSQDRFDKSACPGCERKINLNDPENNFCIDCGLCLFNHCEKCNTRKKALARYCHHCGIQSFSIS